MRRTRRHVSISMLVTLVVVLPIVAVASLLVGLSVITSRQIAERLGEEIVRTAMSRLRSEVSGYLASGVRVSDDYVRRIEAGLLPLKGLTAWEKPMLATLLSEPDIASICFASAVDDATWLLRGKGRLEVGRADGPADHAAVEHVISEKGELLETIRTYQYVPPDRPWHKAALAAGRPVWTPVYFWFGNQGADSTTGTGYTRAVRGASGELLGVLVVDVTLGAISEFLARSSIAEMGYAYIIDEEGLVVAASHGAVNTRAGERARLEQTSSPAAGPLSAAIGERAGERGEALSLRVRIGEEWARVNVAALAPYPGVNWRVLVVLPESVFLADAHDVQRRSILMALIAVAGAVALGVMLSRRLAAPVLALSEHVKRIGRGDLDARLHLKAAWELTELSRELNLMSEGLKHRLVLQQALTLAMQVQQSLLPEADPRPARLEVAGRSRYCDETGGDYYDFVEVMPGRAPLIAVGDVMGHGISSALLMASARASLRTHAPRMKDLGDLLTCVNRVLAEDARHGRFMTMCVAIVDPDAGELRFASAGHEAPLVYDADRGAFAELSGGDLPLGVDTATEYRQYVHRGLGRDDVLVVGTDGIWETANAGAEQFGQERLRELVRAHGGRPAGEIADAIESALGAFRGAAPIEDDVTFVVVRLT